MVKKSRVKYSKRFNFALTEAMQSDIYHIANLAQDDAAEVVRRMIRRETSFFVEYASQHGSLPNGEAPVSQPS